MRLDVRPEGCEDHAAIRRVVLTAFEHHRSVADLVELIRASPGYVPALALVACCEGEVVGHVMLSRAELVDEPVPANPRSVIASRPVVSGDRDRVGGLAPDTPDPDGVSAQDFPVDLDARLSRRRRTAPARPQPTTVTRHGVLVLSPLAVDPAVQRQGIGSALVRAGLARADAMGESLVVLQGSPRYYPRFGFRDARTLGIEMALPDWAPPEAGMAYPLSVHHPAVRGRLVEPPAFAAID